MTELDGPGFTSLYNVNYELRDVVDPHHMSYQGAISPAFVARDQARMDQSTVGPAATCIVSHHRKDLSTSQQSSISEQALEVASRTNRRANNCFGYLVGRNPGSGSDNLDDVLRHLYASHTLSNVRLILKDKCSEVPS